jgi:hypothetical protein
MSQKIDYKRLYLKYKGKYLNLKNKLESQIGGWSNDLKDVFKKNKLDLVERKYSREQSVYDSFAGDPDEYTTYTYSIGNKDIFKIEEVNGIIERDLTSSGKFVFAVRILKGAEDFGLIMIAKFLVQSFQTTSIRKRFSKLKIYISKEMPIMQDDIKLLNKLGFIKEEDSFGSIIYVFDPNELYKITIDPVYNNFRHNNITNLIT